MENLITHTPLHVCLLSRKPTGSGPTARFVSLGCGQIQSTHTHGVEALVNLTADTEATHNDVLTKAMGCVNITRDEQCLGSRQKGASSYGEWLADDALTVRRLNPELEFTWNNPKVQMDTKNVSDLKKMEVAAREFAKERHENTVLRQVREKLCETDEGLQSACEPEPESETLSSVKDWAEEAAGLSGDGEVSLQEAWAALGAAKGKGPAAASLKRAAPEV